MACRWPAYAARGGYARQAEDDQLEKMAVRIRGRAVRRSGELLKEIEPKHTGKTVGKWGRRAP